MQKIEVNCETGEQSIVDFTQEELDAIATNSIQLTPEQVLKQCSENVRRALQAEIDIKANELGFSNGNALMLYAGFTNAFQAMAK